MLWNLALGSQAQASERPTHTEAPRMHTWRSSPTARAPAVAAAAFAASAEAMTAARLSLAWRDASSADFSCLRTPSSSTVAAICRLNRWAAHRFVCCRVLAGTSEARVPGRHTGAVSRHFKCLPYSGAATIASAGACGGRDRQKACCPKYKMRSIQADMQTAAWWFVPPQLLTLVCISVSRRCLALEPLEVLLNDSQVGTSRFLEVGVLGCALLQAALQIKDLHRGGRACRLGAE